MQLDILFGTCHYNLLWLSFRSHSPRKMSDRAVACPRCRLCDPRNSKAHEGFIQVRRLCCIKVKWAASCFVSSWVAIHIEHRETPTKRHLKRVPVCMITRTSLIDFNFEEDDSLDLYRSTDTFLNSKCSCGTIKFLLCLFCSEKCIKYKCVSDCRVFLSEAVWIITSLVLTNTRTMQNCSASFSIAVCSVSVLFSFTDEPCGMKCERKQSRPVLVPQCPWHVCWRLAFHTGTERTALAACCRCCCGWWRGALGGVRRRACGWGLWGSPLGVERLLSSPRCYKLREFLIHLSL